MFERILRKKRGKIEPVPEIEPVSVNEPVYVNKPDDLEQRITEILNKKMVAEPKKKFRFEHGYYVLNGS